MPRKKGQVRSASQKLVTKRSWMLLRLAGAKRLFKHIEELTGDLQGTVGMIACDLISSRVKGGAYDRQFQSET